MLRLLSEEGKSDFVCALQAFSSTSIACATNRQHVVSLYIQQNVAERSYVRPKIHEIPYHSYQTEQTACRKKTCRLRVRLGWLSTPERNNGVLLLSSQQARILQQCHGKLQLYIPSANYRYVMTSAVGSWPQICLLSTEEFHNSPKRDAPTTRSSVVRK